MPAVKKSVERKFFTALKKAFQKLITGIRNGNFTANNIEREVRQFTKSREMEQYIQSAVRNMVETERNDSAKSWREAAMNSTNGRLLYELISEEMNGPVGLRVSNIIARNVQFIKTVPEQWAQYIVMYAYRESLKGRRPEDIEAELRKVIPEHCQKNLKCIARTESAKANAAIVQARAEMCGIKAYIWRSVKDERSRDSHAMMDGILVFYDDPPSPEALFPRKGTKPYGGYHAGNTFNCRCFQEPVVDVDFLPDIIRVHDHGRIIRMSKWEIRKKYGKIA